MSRQNIGLIAPLCRLQDDGQILIAFLRARIVLFEETDAVQRHGTYYARAGVLNDIRGSHQMMPTVGLGRCSRPRTGLAIVLIETSHLFSIFTPIFVTSNNDSTTACSLTYWKLRRKQCAGSTGRPPKASPTPLPLRKASSFPEPHQNPLRYFFSSNLSAIIRILWSG